MANVTFTQVQEIFKTLPVGYYAGRNVPRQLVTDTTATYYDLATDKIVVSYPLIAEAVKDVNINESELEEVVRTLLYHEVSHALLTPNMRVYRHRNILEDERIETILRKYYMNTNFRKVIKLLNPSVDTSKPAENKDEAFYRLVRFRDGDKKWLAKLDQLIQCCRRTTAASSVYLVRELAENYDKFYAEFCEEFKQNQEQQNQEQQNQEQQNQEQQNQEQQNQEQENQEQENQEQENQEQENAQQSDEEQNADEEQDDNKQQESQADEGEDESEEEALFNEDEVRSIVENAVDDVFNKYVDNALHDKLFTVIQNKLKKNKSNGAAINAYSGKINTKSVALRDDYKWFVKQNREGNVKRFSNVHFNLFLDNSGSFEHNDITMNKIIKALIRVEKEIPQFTFDVITINSHKVDEWDDKKEKVFVSDYGTAVYDSIKLVVKKHQKKNASNYNIVMFDGDAHWSESYNSAHGTSDDALRYFDGENSIIISDDENKEYFDACIKKARVIYENYNYCGKLVDNLINLLSKVI